MMDFTMPATAASGAAVSASSPNSAGGDGVIRPPVLLGKKDLTPEQIKILRTHKGTLRPFARQWGISENVLYSTRHKLQGTNPKLGTVGGRRGDQPVWGKRMPDVLARRKAGESFETIAKVYGVSMFAVYEAYQTYMDRPQPKLGFRKNLKCLGPCGVMRESQWAGDRVCQNCSELLRAVLVPSCVVAVEKF